MSKKLSHISKKSKMIAATAFLLGVMAIGGAGLAYADTSPTKTDPMTTLVTTIAQKFNLNPDEVKTVVDQVMIDQHVQMEAQHTQMFADRLAKAVTAGTLTQAQADLISAKEKEIRTAMESLKDKTPEERKAFMKTQRDAMKQWVADNNIPEKFMMFDNPRKGFHGGFKGPGMNTPPIQ